MARDLDRFRMAPRPRGIDGCGIALTQCREYPLPRAPMNVRLDPGALLDLVVVIDLPCVPHFVEVVDDFIKIIPAGRIIQYRGVNGHSHFPRLFCARRISRTSRKSSEKTPVGQVSTSPIASIWMGLIVLPD